MGIKKLILYGGLIAAGIYCANRFTKPTWDNKKEDVLTEVLQTEVSEPKDDKYADVSKSIDQLLKNNPEYANALVQKCIKSMEKGNTKYAPATSMIMFDAVRKKAEENPKITEYLGRNAKAHIRGMRMTKEELGERVKQAYNDLKEKAKEVYDGVMPKTDGGK